MVGRAEEELERFRVESAQRQPACWSKGVQRCCFVKSAVLLNGGQSHQIVSSQLVFAVKSWHAPRSLPNSILLAQEPSRMQDAGQFDSSAIDS